MTTTEQAAADTTPEAAEIAAEWADLTPEEAAYAAARIAALG